MKLKALLLATALALASAPAIAADPNGGLAVTTGSGTTLCAFTGTGSFTQVYTCTIPVYQNSSGVGVAVSTTNPMPETLADGGDITLGSKADAATCVTTNTIMACLRQVDADVKSPPSLGSASGGLSTTRLSALSNTAIAIDASPGQLYLIHCGNTNATEAYVQIWDVAAGSVTVGTTAPKLSIPIQATGTGGFALSIVGIQFGTAISAAATTTATGGSAPSTALDCNSAWK